MRTVTDSFESALTFLDHKIVNQTAGVIWVNVAIGSLEELNGYSRG